MHWHTAHGMPPPHTLVTRVSVDIPPPILAGLTGSSQGTLSAMQGVPRGREQEGTVFPEGVWSGTLDAQCCWEEGSLHTVGYTELVSPQGWRVRRGEWGVKRQASIQPLLSPKLTTTGPAGPLPWLTGHWGAGSSSLDVISGRGCSSHLPCGRRSRKGK